MAAKTCYCIHRSFTDLKRDHALFSFSTSFNPNGVLVFWDKANNELEPHVKDQKTEYGGLDYKLNMWHSICTTWDSNTGLVQMWFDGQPTSRKFSATGPNISGNPIIVIGQVCGSQNAMHILYYIDFFSWVKKYIKNILSLNMSYFEQWHQVVSANRLKK